MKIYRTLPFVLFSASLIFSIVRAEDPIHQSQNATHQFDVHPDLAVELFASEPMMVNPTNIDIDYRGRVWICEVINYRGNKNARKEGDRILILEDTDGDAVADKSTVFYQGRDIDSVHGICVLGDRVLVSAGDSVFYLIDSDGDSVADRKEILFTGISGTQHDHGIHAFVFGPDGKLYFNFGNQGKQIRDANGKPIVDLAGNVVQDARQPYTQGMVFRCNLDGSEFETLAWNFRNNWEMCIDSFGSIWQSDNDDDGNRATRINFVMPFGDYGYTEQGTGKGWKSTRTNLESDIPSQHWHQNDPGVIPNLLITGAGSPTGMCIYEGNALPEIFHNQMIHCDAGPSIVRSYPVKKSGAGYTAEIVNMIDGAKKNQWFRPTDVCVAPDGSLMVSDWYDPGVGGHRMGDTKHGRLFHVTKKENAGTYTVPPVDFSTPEAAALALESPNMATRYLAWTALEKFGAAAESAVDKLWKNDNPRFRARALWMLVHLGLPEAKTLDYLDAALADGNPDIRMTGVRAIVQLRNKLKISQIENALHLEDPAPEVRRTILIGLRQLPTENLAQAWAALAKQYPLGDRWYLEALGIAAEGHWDECLSAWLSDPKNVSDEVLSDSATQDIIWRSRGALTPQLIAQIIELKSTTAAQTARYFRALDFFDGSAKHTALVKLALSQFDDPEKTKTVTVAAASKLNIKDFSDEEKKKLNAAIAQTRGSDIFVSLVGRFSVAEQYDALLEIAADATHPQLGADAMAVLIDKGQFNTARKTIDGLFHSENNAQRDAICNALINCGKDPKAVTQLFADLAQNQELGLDLRILAIKDMGQIHEGALELIRWTESKQEIDSGLMPAMGAALHSAKWDDIKKRANELFPMAPSKDNKPLPSISDLAKKHGDAVHGKTVFENAGTCIKCHVVDNHGTEVGPNLSEIGSKLTREAMYESILFPSAGISHNYENWIVQTIDGSMIIGVLMGETDSEISLKDDKGIEHTIAMEDVEAKKKQKLSLMPADLQKDLSEQDLVDLIEYLTTLKKK